MIPTAVTERLAFLRERLESARQRASALDREVIELRAEISGMETVLEAVTPPPQAAPLPGWVEPRGRRNLRSLVLDTVRREPGLNAAQIAERIGRCRVSQVESAIFHLSTRGEIDDRDGGWRPSGLMQEAAQ